MKESIWAGLAAAGALWLLTLSLLRPAARIEPARVSVSSEPAESGEAEDSGPAETVGKAEEAPDAGGAGSGSDAARTVSVLMDGAVRTVRLDDYLTGVLLAEMPPSFEPEALAAQAVAARTIARGKMDRPKHENACVCGQSDCCQAYLDEEAAREKYGADYEKWAGKARGAVEETDGLVIRCGGELIDAVYFSSAGGATEPAAAVWGAEVPYLQSVESPDGGERFEEETRVGIDAFRAAILRQTPEARLDGGPAGWFGALRRSAGGGVAELEIGGAAYSGTRLRSLFSLRSTKFTVAIEGDEIVFETSGSGHRVGMSQYGAQAMALEGATYREILTHYYQGVEIGP